MYRLFRILFFISFAVSLSSYVYEREKNYFPKNFHSVSSELYRCGQPNRKQMKNLEASGVKTVLNLRKKINDQKKVRKTNLIQIRVPIKTKALDYQDMVTALRAFESANKPVIVHCRRGSDRTGGFVACYRMVYQDWPRERAIKELLNEDLGYLVKLFPNILELIETIDIKQLKQDVFEQ